MMGRSRSNIGYSMYHLMRLLLLSVLVIETAALYVGIPFRSSQLRPTPATPTTSSPATRTRRSQPCPSFCRSLSRSRRLLRLSSSQNNNNDDSETNGSDSNRGRARFSGTRSTSPTTTSSSSTLVNKNPLDSILTFLTSDKGSIILGFLGLFLLLVGRLVFDNDSSFYSDAAASAGGEDAADAAIRLAVMEQGLGEETRSNLLAAFACGAVLVNGISKLDVESAMAETVDLVGRPLDHPVVRMDGSFLDAAADNKTDNGAVLVESCLSWVAASLLAATPAKTVVLLHTNKKKQVWEIQCAAGTVPITTGQDDDNQQHVLLLDSLQVPATTPIIDRFRTSRTNQESYLPTLQALPGRTEFTYLPVNTQAVLLVPVVTLARNENNDDNDDGDIAVLVLGGNQARSFTPRNIAWCQAVASRVGTDLSGIISQS